MSNVFLVAMLLLNLLKNVQRFARNLDSDKTLEVFLVF